MPFQKIDVIIDAKEASAAHRARYFQANLPVWTGRWHPLWMVSWSLRSVCSMAEQPRSAKWGPLPWGRTPRRRAKTSIPPSSWMRKKTSYVALKQKGCSTSLSMIPTSPTWATWWGRDSGPVVEWAGHSPPLGSAEGILCLCVRDMRANWGGDTKLNKQTKNTTRHKEHEDGERYWHPEEKQEFKTEAGGGNTGGLCLVKGWTSSPFSKLIFSPV